MKSTGFLFAQPSFLRGIAKILDLGSTGNIYNSSDSNAQADYRAIMSDWNMTGEDMQGAMDEYKEHYKKELEACGFKE